MTEIPTEAGLFARTANPREVRGLLLPWGEESRVSASKTAPIRFARDTVALPRDPMVVGLNDEHDRFQPLGRATALESTEAGIVATFAIADTDEGDAYLAEPTKRRLSAEIADIVRNGAEGIAGRLTGAALVTEGAFASAALFALGEVEEQPEPEADEAEIPAEAHASVPTPEDATAPEDTTAADAAEPKEDAVADAIAPTTVADSAAIDQARELGANAVFAAMTAVRNGTPEAEAMLAALADIKSAGSGALPAAGVLQPEWVGQVWQGRRYERKYITLGTQGVIRALEAKGFRLDQGTALVQRYGGQKSEMPTGTATTSVVGSTLQSFGFAADIAREFYLLPGGEDVIAAFWEGVVESYARETDKYALERLVAAAGAPVAADTFPATYPAALGMLIQGVETIEDRNDSATFAIANAAAFREILYTAKDKVPHFVEFGASPEHTATVNGVRVIRGDIGIDSTPAVLVGAKSAIRFNEISQTPVQFDALNVAKNGVDKGVVGYVQTMVERPDSLVLIGTADA